MNKSTIVNQDAKHTIPNQKKDLLLFPGEQYQFNRNLLYYKSFSYHNKGFLATKCALLNLNSLAQLSQSKLASTEVTEAIKEPLLTIGKLYTPREDDVVIGVITIKSYEQYRLDIGTSHEAILGSSDFEGATKSTKPNLQVGDVVFARVTHTNHFDNTYLTCKSADSSKTWSTGESLFGQLVGGYLYTFPKIWALKLINNHSLMDRLRDCVDFELCIGLNGKLWINSDKQENIPKIHMSIMKSFEYTKEQMETLLNNTFNIA